MSLCLTFFDKNNIVMSCDSRACMISEGKYYKVHDNAQKIRIVKNKVIFRAGMLRLTDAILDAFEESEKGSIEELQQIAIKLTAPVSKAIKENIINFPFGIPEVLCDLIVAYFKYGKPQIYILRSKDNYKIKKVERSEDIQMQICGIKYNEASDLIDDYIEANGPFDDLIDNWTNNNLLPAVELAEEIYNTLSYEGIGGDLSIYHIDKQNNIALMQHSQIKDSKEVTCIPDKWRNTSFNVAIGGAIASKGLSGVVSKLKAGKVLTIAEKQAVTIAEKESPGLISTIQKSLGITGEEWATATKEKPLLLPKLLKKPTPEIKLPKIGEELKPRSFINSVKSGDITSKDLKDALNPSMYQVSKNKELLNQANKLVNENYDEAVKIVKSEGPATAESNTIAQVLIKKAQDTGRFEEALDLIEHVSKKATDSGQAVQALSMWGRLTPEGMLKYAQRVVNNANISRKLNLKLTPKLAQDITTSMKNIAKLPEGREKTVQIAKVLDKIHTQVPPTLGQKVSAIQTAAQLLNPKTAIRNTVGNAGFNMLENAKDVVGTGIDKFTSIFTGKRTKILPSLNTQFKGLKQGLKLGLDDVKNSVNTANTGTQFDLPMNKPLRGKYGEMVDKALAYELRVPDRAFYQAAYDDSLRQQMKIAKTLQPTKAMEEIAHHDALYRTFQDDNVVSKAFQGLKKTLNLGKNFGAGDMVLKYPKTPANILMRGIDYSPAGFVKTVYEISKPLMGKAFNQKAFIEATSRALVGSAGLVGTGAMLERLGIITGKPDKDYDVSSLQKDAGLGSYKINVSALKRFVLSGLNPDAATLQKGDTLISYDWFQPQAIPLTIGANLSESADGKGSGLIDSIIRSLGEGTNTLAEQPLVQGLTRPLKQRTPSDSLAEVLKGVPASFVPTLLNQVKQLIDNTQRNVNDSSTVTESLNLVRNKIPFLSNTLQPKISTLGKEKEVYQGGSNNLFNVLLNPAFVSKYNPTPVTEKVLDIYNKTGETKHFPRAIDDKSVRSGGKKADLTPQEQMQLQKDIGQKVDQLLSVLVKNPRFNSLSLDEQADIIYKKLDEAGDFGRSKMKKLKGLPFPKNRKKY